MLGRDQRLDMAALVAQEGSVVSLLPLSGHEGVVFVSGQVAQRGGSLVAKGLVGRDVSVELARECARQCARNVLSVLRSELGSLDRVEAVVRLGVYVASADDFTDQHLVAYGASELMLEVFGEDGRHTRTAIGVKRLPLDSPVEVDAIFRLREVDEAVR